MERLIYLAEWTMAMLAVGLVIAMLSLLYSFEPVSLPLSAEYKAFFFMLGAFNLTFVVYRVMLWQAYKF